jgi:hypothetical protein
LDHFTHTVTSGLYLPSRTSSADAKPQSAPTSALLVTDPPNMAAQTSPALLLGNDEMISTTPAEFDASLNSDYDSGIETQSDPPATNGELLHVYGYESSGIQSM